MIRAVAYTREGVAILIGITDGNVERLKAGMPLSLDLGALLVEAGKTEDEPAMMRGKLELFVSYKPTHVEVVQEWLDAGLPIEGGMMEAAREIDATA